MTSQALPRSFSRRALGGSTAGGGSSVNYSIVGNYWDLMIKFQSNSTLLLDSRSLIDILE